nr:MAG TPA: hypothetical protein [Crassvirales sp.]
MWHQKSNSLNLLVYYCSLITFVSNLNMEDYGR